MLCPQTRGSVFTVPHRQVVKAYLCDNACDGRGPTHDSLPVVEAGAEASSEPTESQLASTQNNLHAKAGHPGVACSEPL